MHPIEIIVIVCSIAIVGGVIGRYIYRRVKKLPTGECAYCGTSKKNRLLKDYHKVYGASKCDCEKAKGD